jgi:ABC-2 type transport system ATP-binding protein
MYKPQNSFKIFLYLIYRDLLILKKDFWGTFIDMLIWPTIASIIFGYIMPRISNVGPNYGGFVLLGAIITIATVSALDSATQIISDLDNNRLSDYFLTLPISPYLFFIKQAISITLKSLILTLPIFPLGKLLLLKSFSLLHLSFIKFCLMYLCITVFIGFFALWIISWVKHQDAIIHVWLRLYNPMMWFGGLLFSWKQIYEAIPSISYIMLLNPITYAIEGLRASVLGQENFLNYWICLFILLIYTVFIAIISLKLLHRRLDCINDFSDKNLKDSDKISRLKKITSNDKILEIKNLDKSYKTKNETIEALIDINLDVYKGEIIALLGVNGAGKTTLSSILATLNPPTSGQILFEGESIYKNIDEYKESLGFCPQRPNLDPGLNVYENLYFAGKYFLVPDEKLEKRIKHLMHQFNLSKYKNYDISGLSGGYKQRLIIARAFIHHPKIIILDEPTVGLDPNVRRQIWLKILELKKLGITVIFTTHYLDEAEFLSDRVCILHQGKILLIDKSENLKQVYKKKNLEDVFLHLTQEEAV